MYKHITRFIKGHLQAVENHHNAQAMAAYMKTTMSFHGVKATERRRIAKQAVKQYPIQNQKEYLEVIEELWNQPHREEKYIAIDIARAYPKHIDMLAIPLFEKMIREGGWWDFVDDIAMHLIGTVLRKHSSSMWPIIEQWASDSNLWIRRTAIICQNRFKDKTDQRLLFSFCLQCAHEKEFFIRTAMGWALREYAKTEPQKVYDFVVKNRERISNLSYKEATRGLGSPVACTTKVSTVTT